MDVIDKNYTQVRSQLARDFVYQVSKLKLEKTEEVRGSTRSQSVNSRYVAAESVSLGGSLVHLSCINSQHELVLAAQTGADEAPLIQNQPLFRSNNLCSEHVWRPAE
jgi:hypothetical protein